MRLNPIKTVKIGIEIDGWFSHFMPEVTAGDIFERTSMVHDLFFEKVGYDLKFEIVEWFRSKNDDPYQDVPQHHNSQTFKGRELYLAFRNRIRKPDSAMKQAGVDHAMLLTRRYWGQAGVTSPVSACQQRPGPLMILGVNQFVIAHEIAHILGAGHDLNSDREEDRRPFLMAASAASNTKFEFSPRSYDHFAQTRADGRFDCLPNYVPPAPDPDPDPDPVFDDWDVNKDGRVNIGDVMAILQSLYVPGAPMVNADFNGDGRTDLADALWLIQELHGPKVENPNV
jgi:hypothetical protein